MIFKKEKKKRKFSETIEFTLCKCVHQESPFFVLLHHAGKERRSSRVVRVGKVRRGVERSAGARGVDAMSIGAQRKSVDGLLRPRRLQGFRERLELHSGVPPPLPALTRHLPVTRLNSVLLHGQGSVHLMRGLTGKKFFNMSGQLWIDISDQTVFDIL